LKNELNKVIRSRATLANVEGSETRWLATNLACNTPKESDDFDIQIEADDIVRACVKAQESHRNDDSACRTTSSNIQGYFVPEEFINSTFVIPEANGGQLRDACTVLRVNSKDGYVPTLDSVAMSYLAEEAAYTGAEQTPTVGQVSFGVLKIAGLTRVSDELLADSVPNLPALLTQIFQSANGRFQDKEILAGNGTARYNGIVNGVDGAGSSVTYSTLANATSVIASDIVSAYFNVPQQHRGVENFRWIFPSAISALINGIGATAAGVHAIDSLTNAPDAFLMGRQVLNVDVAGQPFGTTITSTEKIGLAGNMSAYYLFERAGMSIRRNDSLYMGNGQVGFFATARSDGRMATAEAFKILRAA
jgi:HK97 family phage major capsid protein